MTRLYLVRHGQTVWNQEKRFQGSLNSDLTETGIEQATKLYHRLAKIDIDKVYSSPKERAFETAKIITGQREDILIEDAFTEMSFGNWEGRLYEEVMALEPDMFYALFNTPELYKPTSGESFKEVQDRVLKKVFQIVKEFQGRSVLLVAHGIVIKTILSYIDVHFGTGKLGNLVVPSASLSVIKWMDEAVELEMITDCSHLNEERS